MLDERIIDPGIGRRGLLTSLHVDLDVVGFSAHYLLIVFVVCSRVSDEVL